MDNNGVSLQDTSMEHQCEKCKEYQNEVEIFEVALLVLAFLGPIIGMLIGMFAVKKLLRK
ncbi:MAG: hypothetical protein FWE24_09045 [Defluviitaleaceae bacterium]|nr:hypothetical protein [Defluviitaleaceae bacterium]